jgi:putative ABC transport system permease protein
VVRAARQSTVAALEDAARVPRRRARVIALSAHLPAPLLLGVRLAFRRPARLLLSVFSVAVTTSGLVVVLILHQTVSGVLGPVVSQATTTISLMLVLLAAANAVFIAWTTALETRHPAAVARALGATPRQVATGLSVALMLLALLGALLGIPGGIGLHYAAKQAGATPVPPVLWLVVMVVVLLMIIAVLTAVPVIIDARRPVVDVLQSETT